MLSNDTTDDSSLNGCDEVVVSKNMETIDAFSSCVIPMKVGKAKVGKAYMGECINIMIQVLWTKYGSLL